MKAYVPDAGDVVWLAFDPQAGHEKAGRRPALVLTPARYNAARGMMICCPMTSKIKGYVFEVVISREAAERRSRRPTQEPRLAGASGGPKGRRRTAGPFRDAREDQGAPRIVRRSALRNERAGSTLPVGPPPAMDRFVHPEHPDPRYSGTPETISSKTSFSVVSEMARSPTLRPRFSTMTRSPTSKMSVSRCEMMTCDT